jgi:hypothetical protein
MVDVQLLQKNGGDAVDELSRKLLFHSVMLLAAYGTTSDAHVSSRHRHRSSPVMIRDVCSRNHHVW